MIFSVPSRLSFPGLQTKGNIDSTRTCSNRPRLRARVSPATRPSIRHPVLRVPSSRLMRCQDMYRLTRRDNSHELKTRSLLILSRDLVVSRAMIRVVLVLKNALRRIGKQVGILNGGFPGVRMLICIKNRHRSISFLEDISSITDLLFPYPLWESFGFV